MNGVLLRAMVARSASLAKGGQTGLPTPQGQNVYVFSQAGYTLRNSLEEGGL